MNRAAGIPTRAGFNQPQALIDRQRVPLPGGAPAAPGRRSPGSISQWQCVMNSDVSGSSVWVSGVLTACVISARAIDERPPCKTVYL